jgi:hypothetical protein
METISMDQLDTLCEDSSNSFQYAKRIDYKHLDFSVLEEEIFYKRAPLVVTNVNSSLRRHRDTFSFDSFANLAITVRNAQTNNIILQSTTRDYLDVKLSSPSYSDVLPCPPAWKQILSQKIPHLFAKGNNGNIGD